MKKTIWMPVLTILLAAVVLFAASAGLSTVREENARKELESMLHTVLPGSGTFTEEAYTGEDTNIRTAYKSEAGFVVHVVTSGYAGDITMLVGVSNDGKVQGGFLFLRKGIMAVHGDLPGLLPVPEAGKEQDTVMDARNESTVRDL